MFKRIHDRLGTAGLIVSVIALVLALTGGAYAAKSGLTSKQKKEVKSIATSVAKPGPKGDQGAAGKDGTNGANGSPGATGKSIKLTSVDPGEPECNELGGAQLAEEGSSAPAVEVCNGEEGAEGSPWTAGGTLPTGSTETGTWELSEGEGPAGKHMWAPISFAIPLASKLEASEVHFQTEENFADFDEGGPGTAGCKLVKGQPTAPPGNLCVYYEPPIAAANFLVITNLSRGGAKEATKVGALLEFESVAPGEPGEYPLAAGSFAVTGK